SLTVTRGMEGTTAQNWSLGDFAFCSPTAGAVASIIGSLAPTVTGTLPTGDNVVIQPGTIVASISLTLPASPQIGATYTIYGSASAFSVTVKTSVSSGSPYMGFPNGSPVYTYAIPASSPMEGLICIWDGSNWRCAGIGGGSGRLLNIQYFTSNGTYT